MDVNHELKLFEIRKKSGVVGWGSGGCELVSCNFCSNIAFLHNFKVTVF